MRQKCEEREELGRNKTKQLQEILEENTTLTKEKLFFQEKLKYLKNSLNNAKETISNNKFESKQKMNMTPRNTAYYSSPTNIQPQRELSPRIHYSYIDSNKNQINKNSKYVIQGQSIGTKPPEAITPTPEIRVIKRSNHSPIKISQDVRHLNTRESTNNSGHVIRYKPVQYLNSRFSEIISRKTSQLQDLNEEKNKFFGEIQIQNQSIYKKYVNLNQQNNQNIVKLKNLTQELNRSKRAH